VWQALVWGFAGLRPEGDVLAVDPHLPEEWEALVVTVTFLGVRLRFRIAHDRIDVDASAPTTLRLPDGERRLVPAGATSFPRTAGTSSPG
jgi:alpha,alpha-trehalose phosphorylase